MSVPRRRVVTASAILAAGLLIAFLAVTVGAASRRGWPMRREGADILVETPNYKVRTDLGPEVAQAVAVHQEVLYAELYRRMGKIKSRKMRGRFKVLVFGTYDRYQRELGGNVAGSQGVFMPSKDVLACWGRADRLEMILSTLRHEGTHQFVAHFIGPNCPLWLDEGLAVFYEHGKFSKGKLVIGRVPPGHVSVLRKAIEKDTLIPLSRMLGRSNEQWADSVRAGGPEGHLQYCQAWAMVHFLAYGAAKKYQPAFLQYMHYVSRGRPSGAAWERTFGPNYEAFEKRWSEYVNGLEPAGDMVCRAHLRVLGWLLVQLHDSGRQVKDIATFRREAVEGKLGRWSVQSPDGSEVSSEDKEQLAGLFRCPDDKRTGDQPSYELVPGKKGQPPILRCRCHPGVVLETEYVEDYRTGRLEARTVERAAKPAGGKKQRTR